MNLPVAMDKLLPELKRDQPESEWIHTTSVTGPYGITASVKDFDEVLDWQEHRRELTQGYYRLIHPPRVQDFKARLEAKYPGRTAVLYVSGPLAEKELREWQQVNGLNLPVTSFDSLPEAVPKSGVVLLDLQLAGVVLTLDPEHAVGLHERNRRRGGSLSVRSVDALITGSGEVEKGLQEKCAARLLEMEKADQVFFYPSGMGAVTAALDVALTAEQPRMLVLGNVYRDTHLLLEEQAWAGREVHTDFLDTDDLAGLEAGLEDPALAGVLLETITNPLIEIPDLPRIAALCQAAGKPLLVDSTMAGPLNACPLELGATIVIHSTSKYLSGSNVHGGGVVLTSDPVWAEKLANEQRRDQNFLSAFELPALWEGIQSYPERMQRFNRNGDALAEMLRSHPAVETVYFANAGRPDWLKGLGSVVSCELKDASLDKVAAFFDAELPGVVKAPSLGSNQTLFCPYVLLAYYDKSDEYLRDCGLSKTLLRFAAGCEEDFGPVLEGIRKGLEGCL